jgi:toxin FitB
MLLLDTNVISELRRPSLADANVLAWASSSAVTNFFISVISVLEIEIGCQRLARQDKAQASVLRAWIEGQIFPQFEDRILPIDTKVALRCAKLHVPDRCSERDAFIAATALEHGMTVVTRNTKDFANSGVKLLNPWDARTK